MAYNNIQVGKLSPGERFFWDGNYYTVISKHSDYVNGDALNHIHKDARLVMNTNNFRLHGFHPHVMVQPLDEVDYEDDDYPIDHFDLGGK